MELEFTGERVLPGMPLVYGVIEHLHRYAVARDFCGGRTVLDIASGEGYGASLLAAVAAFVYGVEISCDAVDHARTKYRAPNLSFLVGDAAAIPIHKSRAMQDECAGAYPDERNAAFGSCLKEAQRLPGYVRNFVHQPPDNNDVVEPLGGPKRSRRLNQDTAA